MSCHTFYASNPLEKKIFGLKPFTFRSILESSPLQDLGVSFVDGLRLKHYVEMSF